MFVMPTPLRNIVTSFFSIVSVTLACGSIALATVSSSTGAADDNRIYVAAVAGAVDVSVRGRGYGVDIGSMIELPSLIVTGEDGTLDLKQTATSISIAQNSEISIPETAQDGQLIARLIQHRGNVFYDVAKREVGKFRVETPYLVAVIKGTQFNVSVQNNATTISLFEGRLELLSPDGSETIDLVAGEIAIRSLDEPGIRVLGMNDPGPGVGVLGLGERMPDRIQDGVSLPTVDDVAERTAAASNLDEYLASAIPNDDGAPGLDPGVAAESGFDSTLGAAIQLDGSPAVGVDASVGLGSGVLDVGLDAGLDLGSGSIDVGLDTGLDLGGGVAIDTGLDAGLDLGAGSADVGLDAGLDLGGSVAIDTGLDAGLDLGAGSADVSLDAGLDLGGVAIDTGLDTSLDLDNGGLDTGIGADIDLGGVDVDAGLDTGVDLSGGTVDIELGAGVDLGGADVDVDLDVDLDLEDGVLDDVVDLLSGGGLGGLLSGRP
jgi:hypothetical protein